jgi:hypothetical protein
VTERSDTPIFDVHAEDQEAEGKRYAAEVEAWLEKRKRPGMDERDAEHGVGTGAEAEVASSRPRQMTVRDMTETLADLPPDAMVLICAHEWPGMENQGWYVQALDPSNDGKFVLIEGAGPIPQGVNDGHGDNAQ